MARGAPVYVMGIWLKRDGDYVVVSAEDIYGHDVELIREHIDGPFSHNISEHGIGKRFSEEYRHRTYGAPAGKGEQDERPRFPHSEGGE